MGPVSTMSTILAVKVRADDALMKGATLGIAGSIWLVEGVRMSNENHLNAAISVRDSLDLEGTVI
jgi:hypothetical protein